MQVTELNALCHYGLHISRPNQLHSPDQLHTGNLTVLQKDLKCHNRHQSDEHVGETKKQKRKETKTKACFFPVRHSKMDTRLHAPAFPSFMMTATTCKWCLTN